MNPTRRLLTLITTLCAAVPGGVMLTGCAVPGRPNVVLIMTDNHGAWTLGCYGNREIHTPNIDRLAAEGTLFTRAYCTNSVCSPSRATFLTGLVPSQHGVHSYLVSNRLQIGQQARNTLAEFRSLPEIFSEAGYTCGLTGKWHLGDNIRPQEGFSYWYTMPHGATVAFHDAPVIWNGKITKEPKYLTEAITDHAVTFLEQNRRRRFFLFVSYNGPYGLGRSFLKTHENRHTAYYADKRLPSFPREEPHLWLHNNKKHINNPVAIRGYAAAVSGVDDGVGRVMATLKRLRLDENTVVIFTADQGLCGGHQGFWGMGDHSRPIHTREPTVRIPMIWRQPGPIPAGVQNDMMVASYDFFPTLLTYAGLDESIPTERPLPGRDFSPALAGRRIDWENVIFHEYENVRMIRTDTWKYTHRHPSGPHELYRIDEDPEERMNLAEATEYAGIVEALRGRLESFFGRYRDPRYDLLHAGESQTKRLLKEW